MSNILLILGHSDGESLSHALAHRYEQCARTAGVSIERIELAKLQFDPILRRGYRGEQPLEPDLARAFQAMRSARHVVFFFPTWWAAPPALVKGFIDRVFLPGAAFRHDPQNMLPVGLLAGRSARVVTTMDAPRFWYSLRYGRALHGSFVHATLRFCGFSPVATNVGYGLKSAPPGKIESLFKELERAAAHDARTLLRSSGPLARGRSQTAAP